MIDIDLLDEQLEQALTDEVRILRGPTPTRSWSPPPPPPPPPPPRPRPVRPDPIDVAEEPRDEWLADEDEWATPPPPAPKAVKRSPAPKKRAVPKVVAPAPPEPAPAPRPEPARPKSAFAPRVEVGWEKPEIALPVPVAAPPPPPRNPAAERIRMAARRVNAHPRLAVDPDEAMRDRRQQVLAHLMADESPPPDSQTAAEWAAMCTKLKPHVEPEAEPNYWRWSRQ